MFSKKKTICTDDEFRFDQQRKFIRCFGTYLSHYTAVIFITKKNTVVKYSVQR